MDSFCCIYTISCHFVGFCAHMHYNSLTLPFSKQTGYLKSLAVVFSSTKSPSCKTGSKYYANKFLVRKVTTPAEQFMALRASRVLITTVFKAKTRLVRLCH